MVPAGTVIVLEAGVTSVHTIRYGEGSVAGLYTVTLATEIDGGVAESLTWTCASPADVPAVYDPVAVTVPLGGLEMIEKT